MTNENNTNNNENTKTPMFKRVLAILGIVLLLGVYVVFFIQALFGQTGPGSAFAACAASTIAIPIILWLILWVYTALTGKTTVASADPYGRNVVDTDKGDNK
ncbi:hypothetical protein [Butyrivibrio sp. AE3004]|uniref:hypothetical protein n=1 Tax=Butyrivibrio sp. AE3004 TaxID=1506994 RepID=UPI00068C3453|nr:hypothetical protein [Butyrivibrio sp. AE3004]